MFSQCENSQLYEKIHCSKVISGCFVTMVFWLIAVARQVYSLSGEILLLLEEDSIKNQSDG